MRIAFLCKRRYMNKDVILDRYARLYEIPRQLALLGHDVLGLCMSYYPANGIDMHDANAGGRLRWVAPATGRWRFPDVLAYPRRALKMLRDFKPDVLIGASDAPHAVLTQWLARRLRVPYVIDLYDNFESFGLSRIPGMVPALRRAVRNADLVTTTSEPLREFVQQTYGARGEVIAMPSTVDKAIFHPRDKLACRRALGLPENAKLIGTAGGLYRDKGITALYDAWQLLIADIPDLHLVLAGPHEAATPPPQGDRVHYLGPLPHERVAELFAALDVGVICILDTPFGHYCFPQKAYEMLACELPVVAADVGAMNTVFADVPQCLYGAGDPVNLAHQLRAQLKTPLTPDVRIDDWQGLLAGVNSRLRKIADAARTS